MNEKLLIVPTILVAGGLLIGVISQEGPEPYKHPVEVAPHSVLRNYAGWFIPYEYLYTDQHGKVVKRYWRSYDPIFNPRVEIWVYEDGTEYEVNYVQPSMWDDPIYPAIVRLTISMKLREKERREHERQQ